MSKKEVKKEIKNMDPENELADQINEKLKLDKTGNVGLILACIFEFLLLILFDYLFCKYIFHDEFDLLSASIISAIITIVIGYLAYKRRNKNK